MKRIVFLAALAVIISSCGLQYATETVSVEVKYPSLSGVELSGRSMGVVYTYTDVPEDSLFSANLAEGFARKLEENYFSGETLLDIYTIHRNPEGNYGQIDTLVRLVMDTECDVVFLIDCERGVENEASNGDSYPLSMGLYAYDSLDPEDGGVKFFKGAVNSVTDEMAEDLGKKAASKFSTNWKRENYSIYYFYDSNAWWEAYSAAADMNWAEALKQWISLADTNNLLKRSCAEYNAALACYMLGDMSFALKWLDMSDSDDKRPVSDALRKRIIARGGSSN